MPLYMDRHNVPGLTVRDAAKAHLKDLEIQEEYKCISMTYWVDEERGNVFCLIDAPNKQAVREMHNKAHGLIPNDIIEVDSSLVKAFLGRIHDPDTSSLAGTPDPSIINEPAFRYILVIDLKDRILFDCLYGKLTGSKLIKTFNSLVQQSIHHYLGRLIENHEGFLASFASVTNAVDCALYLHNSVQFQNTCHNLPKINIKMGLSAGYPIAGNDALFGDAIKRSKRLCFFSESDKIYLTSLIKDEYRGNSPQVFNSNRLIRILNPEEDLFLNRLLDEIQNTPSEQMVKLKVYCQQLGVSTSKLYRDTVNITGFSPLDLLKEIKLTTALHLMQKQNKNISETSYELGFTNPSYFTKCFKKRFNVLPADFLKTIHNQVN